MFSSIATLLFLAAARSAAAAEPPQLGDHSTALIRNPTTRIPHATTPTNAAMSGGRSTFRRRLLIVILRYARKHSEAAMKNATTNAACEPPANGEAPDTRPVEGPEADDELATLAKAIGHPARVQIMRLLVRREACICGDIVDELPLAQSTVSQHLKVLKEAGLVRGDIDGPRICYCVEPRTLRRLKALVGGL
jgi:ArsR family transcriptional regulator